MSPVSPKQGRLMGPAHGFSPAEVHVNEREQSQSAVMVAIVVPGKEVAGPDTGVSQISRALRVVRRVPECLELSPGKRDVIRDVRSGVVL
jgi:hypothetical protein